MKKHVRLFNAQKIVLFEVRKYKLFFLNLFFGNFEASEGDDDSFSYFFEFLEGDFILVLTDHRDHLLDLLRGMGLFHAVQKEWDILKCKTVIFVNIYDLESLQDIIVAVDLPLHLISSHLFW